MNPLTLTLRETPPRRVDLSALRPQQLSALNAAEIMRIALPSGNATLAVGDLFDLSDGERSQLLIRRSHHRLDCIGAGMTAGKITLQGDAGSGVGRGLSGGQIEVQGSVGDYLGAGMEDGRILIGGNSGDFAGGALPGASRGMGGGLIVVRGNTGARTGDRQRRGMILVEGDCADYCGSRMIAGTIAVLGTTGHHAGFAMRRGTLVLGHHPESLPATFNDGGMHDLGVLSLLFAELRRHASDPTLLPASPPAVRRLLGDLAVGGLGEVLVMPDGT